MRLPWLWFAMAACLAVGCGRVEPVAPAGGQEPAFAPQFFDFGTIPHGKAAEHDFVLDTRKVQADLVCVGVRVDCSCARYEMLLRDRDGKEREIHGQPLPESGAREGEVLVIRIQIDTARKEAVDLPPAQSRATVLLQHAGNRDPMQRIEVALNLRYAIDCPVKLQPFAILDFETVPMSMPRKLVTWLRSDLPGREVHFGPAHCDDPRIQLALEPDGDATALHATFTPDASKPPGMFRALVSVGTDLPDGYEVHLAAVGKVIPDLMAEPMAKLSLGEFDFATAGAEQFLLVHDHDRRRSAEFVVARFVDRNGQDASSHFSVRLEPLSGDDRGFRLIVRYLGGLQPPSFRGELVLAKDKQAGPFLPIEVVAFHHRAP